MESTSLGSRLVSIAARSPARSSTGPDVWRRFTPISRAMMCARVVFPSPGGPKSSAWSSASLRWRAAAMKTPSCSRIFAWPTYSESCLGRRARSSPSSWGEAWPPEIRRSASITWIRSSLRQGLQGLADGIGELQVRRQSLRRCLGLALIIAKGQERTHDFPARRAAIRTCRGGHLRQLVAQLEQQALCRLLADAGDLREAAGILRRNRRRKVVDRETREHRERHLGAHAADLEELAERAAFGGREDAVQKVRILAHDQVREQRHLLPRTRQRIERAHGNVDLVADPVAGDD